MAAPLQGITVLDLTRLLPGPFATQLLANLGADVIKIEDPSAGDYMRAVPPSVHGISFPFVMVNRGKRSLGLNLKAPEGREILRRLLVRADVLVEQFRPGTMKKFGADYESTRTINPRLVYCSFSGYGATGPSRDLPGHDINFEAGAGLLGVTAEVHGRPSIPGVPIADLASASIAAFAILAALRTRDLTGLGEFVDVSIFDAAVSLMVLNLAHHIATGEEPRAGETILTGRFPFYDLYETRDGRWLAVAAVETKFWKRLCELLELPDLVETQFGDEAALHRVGEALAAKFRSKSLTEWQAILVTEDLPITPVRWVSEVVRDEHVRARRLLPVVDIPGLGKIPVLGHPAKHSVSEVRNPERVPSKGEDTEAILASLGYANEAIEDLARRGVVAR